MPLVNYSSDSSFEEHKSKKRKTAHQLPPLPDNFRDLYATPVRSSKEDDPSLHGGRQRVTSHIEGNWPTHVYTECKQIVYHEAQLTVKGGPSISQRKSIQRLIELYSADNDEIHDFLFSDLGVPAPLHISLSCSLGLKAEQRTTFAEELRSSIEQTNVQPFEVGVCSVEWVSNFTQSRWFLVLYIQTEICVDLRALLDASNRTAARFGQKELYAEESTARINDPDPEFPAGPRELKENALVTDDNANETSAELPKTFDSFHVSIAWTLSKPSSLRTSNDPSLAEQLLLEIKVPINAVKAKIGNNILTFPLKATSSQKPTML